MASVRKFLRRCFPHLHRGIISDVVLHLSEAPTYSCQRVREGSPAAHPIRMLRLNVVPTHFVISTSVRRDLPLSLFTASALIFSLIEATHDGI